MPFWLKNQASFERTLHVSPVWHGKVYCTTYEAALAAPSAVLRILGWPRRSRLLLLASSGPLDLTRSYVEHSSIVLAESKAAYCLIWVLSHIALAYRTRWETAVACSWPILSLTRHVAIPILSIENWYWILVFGRFWGIEGIGIEWYWSILCQFLHRFSIFSSAVDSIAQYLIDTLLGTWKSWELM